MGLDSVQSMERIAFPESTLEIDYDWDSLYLKNKSHKGFLMKLIDGYKRLSTDKDVKFWLASSIETFLRGNNPYFQLFFARSNIFGTILNEI